MSEKHLQKVIDEIISTEVSYHQDLVTIVKIVIPVFNEQAKKRRNGITNEKVRSIFSNVETIEKLHENLLKELQSREIARVFLEFSDFLKLYTSYANNYEKSLDTLSTLSKNRNRQWKKFQIRLQNQTGRSLSSLLIVPIQRIPRYEMLLNQVNKFTPDEDSSKPDIEVCCKKIKEIADFVNNEKKKIEDKNKLTEIRSEITGPFTVISPSRVFINKETVLLSAGAIDTFTTKRKHQLFLFNDIIVWTDDKGKYEGSRFLQDVETSTLKHSPEYLVLSQQDEHSVEISFSSVETREKWDMYIVKARVECVDRNAGRLAALFRSRTNLLQEADASGIEEDFVELKNAPMESGPLFNMINTALKDKTVERIDHTIESLEQSDAPEQLTDLKKQLAEMKRLLDSDSMAMYDIFNEDSVIENVHKQATRISQKVAVTMKKIEGFSASAGRKKTGLHETFNNKFEAETSILKETLFDFLEMEYVDEPEEKSIVQEFWSNHFGDTTISDFGSMKKFYESDFSISLNDKTCSNLLFHLAYPRNTEFETNKEYPVSLKDFEIVANELGFPFDLSKLESASRDNSISVVENARKNAFRELVYTGHPEDIDDYLTHGNRVEMLKNTFDNGNTVFHLIAKRGDPEILEVVLPKTQSRSEMPTLGTLNSCQALPIHFVVLNDKSDEFPELQDRLFELTPKEALDAHPVLHAAVRHGNISVVEKILKWKNIDPNMENAANETPLSIAAVFGYVNIAKRLIEYSAVPDENSVKAAIDGDSPKILKMLLDAQPADRDILKPADEQPLIYHAAFLGTKEVVDELLQHDPSVMEQHEGSSETPFLVAVMGGNISVARHLHSCFENVVSDTMSDGKTALHLSAECGDVEMAKSMVELGVDVNAQDNQGNTCLMLSAINGETEVVDTLMEHPEIDINSRNNFGQSAFELAQSNEKSEICEKLAKSGADSQPVDADISDTPSSTPLHPPPPPKRTPAPAMPRIPPPIPTDALPVPISHIASPKGVSRSLPSSPKHLLPTLESEPKADSDSDVPTLEKPGSPRWMLKQLIEEREDIGRQEKKAMQQADRDMMLMWGKRLVGIDSRILFLQQQRERADERRSPSPPPRRQRSKSAQMDTYLRRSPPPGQRKYFEQRSKSVQTDTAPLPDNRRKSVPYPHRRAISAAAADMKSYPDNRKNVNKSLTFPHRRRISEIAEDLAVPKKPSPMLADADLGESLGSFLFAVTDPEILSPKKPKSRKRPSLIKRIATRARTMSPGPNASW